NLNTFRCVALISLKISVTTVCAGKVPVRSASSRSSIVFIVKKELTPRTAKQDNRTANAPNVLLLIDHGHLKKPRHRSDRVSVVDIMTGKLQRRPDSRHGLPSYFSWRLSLYQADLAVCNRPSQSASR